MIQAQLYSLVAYICKQQFSMDSKFAQSSMGYLCLSDTGSHKCSCLLDNKDMQNYPYDAERYLFMNRDTILSHLKRNLLCHLNKIFYMAMKNILNILV